MVHHTPFLRKIINWILKLCGICPRIHSNLILIQKIPIGIMCNLLGNDFFSILKYNSKIYVALLPLAFKGKLCWKTLQKQLFFQIRNSSLFLSHLANIKVDIRGIIISNIIYSVIWRVFKVFCLSGYILLGCQYGICNSKWVIEC